MEDDYKVAVESRIPESVVADLAKMGILVKPLPRYDYHMGTFQTSWRDAQTGLLHSTAGPRRSGHADGF
jgi:gamma-glutamyltranspeptidase/glutathione hydrolase